jgi:hypothetical protein
MAKRQKNRQHNGQKTEEQTTQWPKDRRTDNTMVKRQKNRQHNGQKKKDKQRSEKTCIKLMIYIVTIWDRLFISFFMKYVHAFHYLFSLLYAFFYSSACTKPGK